MALVIDTTPGSASANSYATVAEANIYNESVLTDSEAWVDAETPIKNRALVTATRLLDMNIRWTGERRYFGQALDWPRYAAVDSRDARWYLDNTIIPPAVKNATAELARRLIVSGMPDVPSQTEGMKRLKAGPVDIEWFESAEAKSMIDRYVFDMVAHLTIRTSEGGSIVVPLVRV
jgi:hypothetical protein